METAIRSNNSNFNTFECYSNESLENNEPKHKKRKNNNFREDPFAKAHEELINLCSARNNTKTFSYTDLFQSPSFIDLYKKPFNDIFLNGSLSPSPACELKHNNKVDDSPNEIHDKVRIIYLLLQ